MGDSREMVDWLDITLYRVNMGNKIKEEDSNNCEMGRSYVLTASLIPWSFLNSSAASLYSGLSDLQWPHLVG